MTTYRITDETGREISGKITGSRPDPNEGNICLIDVENEGQKEFVIKKMILNEGTNQRTLIVKEK